VSPEEHILAAQRALDAVRPQVGQITRWGRHLAVVLTGGGRLLAVGNGGSAAQAQHLTSELVGRYRDERQPLSAIALHAETSTLTALANDYPPCELFARQVRAHGRQGDVLLALSTSGRSANVLAAVESARRAGLSTWALTGPPPNPLALAVDGAVCVEATTTATVQEVHQVLVHLLCEAIDEELVRDDALLAEVEG
jgi:D-sedoheptulose 7-phosphate isomerase